MADKNDIPVVINGRIYNLSGYENTDYLQEVANYMNSKIAECKASDGFRRLNAEYQNIRKWNHDLSNHLLSLALLLDQEQFVEADAYIQTLLSKCHHK